MLAAVLLWLVLGMTFWDTFSGWIAGGLDAIGIQTWLEGVEPRWVANAIQALVHLILFVPLVFLTALVITALFAMPALIGLAAERDYPQLKRENGGGMAGSLLNALLALGIFIAIWALTLHVVDDRRGCRGAIHCRDLSEPAFVPLRCDCGTRQPARRCRRCFRRTGRHGGVWVC